MEYSRAGTRDDYLIKTQIKRQSFKNEMANALIVRHRPKLLVYINSCSKGYQKI